MVPTITMRIPGILELTSRTKYGMTSRNVPIYLFRPLDTTIPPCIVGSSNKDTSTNVLALVDVTDIQPTKLTRGNLVRILGSCGDIRAEREALLLQYSEQPWKKFDTETIKRPSFEGRKLIEGYTLNIDPFGCQDIDDVLTFGDDGYMYITIADVSAWFLANEDHSFIHIAGTLGQTLYDSGRVVAPLLPFEKECSLLPGEERLGISLKFRWTGKIEDISFERTRVINNKTFTYENIYQSNKANQISEIASYLAGYQMIDSHKWIEQLMLFYNCEAAKILAEKGVGLLRVHETPDEERLNEYSNILGPDAIFLAYKSAEYVWASNNGERRHWGLNKEHYCHASSPIRRYADIINQTVLSNSWDSELEVNSEMLNELSKKAKKFDRDSFFLNKVLDFRHRSTDGIVINDHRVWAPDWKRVITCKNVFTPGTKGLLHYSLDMNQSTWKRRMVFRFEDTGYLG
jgi:exoribonuclease R